LPLGPACPPNEKPGIKSYVYYHDLTKKKLTEAEVNGISMPKKEATIVTVSILLSVAATVIQ
jgi:hypothetical protein